MKRKLITGICTFCALYAGVSGNAGQPADPHAHHRVAMQSNEVRITHAEYRVPDVVLRNENGNEVVLKDLLESDRPIALNFIFTSCTTICPVMTSTMIQLQKRLRDDPQRPDFISVSIDPDFDSVPVLKRYADQYGASWTFLTGAHEDVMAVLEAFDAYRGNKVNHFALTLMRRQNESEWIRVTGLSSSEKLQNIWERAGS